MTRQLLTDRGNKPRWFDLDASTYWDGGADVREGLYRTRHGAWILRTWTDDTDRFEELSDGDAGEWMLRQGYVEEMAECLPAELVETEI